MKQYETKKNITDIIRQFSIETGIPLQFVEKDIYVIKILSILSNINYPDIKIAFSGGTCLSKAYGKIKRFSEDIDFCIYTRTPFSRKDKSNFRKFIISELDKDDDFQVIEPITVTDESGFFSFEVGYNKEFESLTNLRKNIKVEFKFDGADVNGLNLCEVKTFIHPFINDKTVKFECVNIFEIMANKFSALLWRSYIKDRTKPLYSKENDPTIMRHLYDIATLEDELKTIEFKKLVQTSFNKDKARGGIEDNYSLSEFSKIVIEKIINDKLFEKEYIEFVDSMCYSKEKMSFDVAINSFKNIIDYVSY